MSARKRDVTETLGMIAWALWLSVALGFGLWVLVGVLGMPGWCVGVLWIGVVVWWVAGDRR